MKRKIDHNKPIMFLGTSLDIENFPKLYRWAKENPQTLNDQIKSIANAWHEGNVSSAMVALESDLEHG